MPADPDLLDFTAEIVAAHVAHSSVDIEQLPELIRSVYRTLAGLASGVEVGATDDQAPTPAEQERPEPAVPIKRSITPDYVVCLECGMRAVILKSHLATRHGLTPKAYRARWGVPHDYLLTAPRYAERRSAMAKQLGFGRIKPAAEEPTTPPRRRGRTQHS